MGIIYRIFSGNNLLNAVIIALFAILLWVPSFISLPPVPMQDPIPAMPFYDFILRLVNVNIFLSRFIAFIIFGLIAIFLNYLNTKFILTPERNFLPSYFFILITSLFSGIQEFNPVLPASLFMLGVFYFILISYKDDRDSIRFFDIGLLLGTGSLLYAPILFFIILIWVAMIIMRPFSWREWLYPILGILLVYILVWAYYFVFLEDGNKIFQLLLINLSPSFLFPKAELTDYIAMLYLFVLLVIASVYILKIYQYHKVYLRLYFTIFFWAFVISALIFIYNTGESFFMLYLMSIPVVFLFSNYFATATKKISNRILFSFGFLLVIFIKIYTLIT